MNDDKKELFEKQKEMIDTFLKTGAIDKEQYDKSLNGLKEKMGLNTILYELFSMYYLIYFYLHFI